MDKASGALPKKLRTLTKNILSLSRQDLLFIFRSPRCLLILIILTLFMIIIPTFDINLFKPHSVELRCSDKYLEKYSYLEWANEVRIIRPNLESEEPGPIVGNGRIMVQIGHESDEIKIIDQDKTVDLGLDFLYRLENGHSDLILDYNKGIIQKSTCISTDSNSCNHVTQRFYVHRSRNIIIQTIRASVFSSHGDIKEKRIDLEQNSKLEEQFESVKSDSQRFKLYCKKQKNDDGDYFISFAVENTDKQLKLSRENGKTIGQRIAYGLGDTCEDASNKAKSKIESVLDMSLSKLLDEHETAWKELLHTGIHLDPVDPDPHHIMPTSYYVNATVYALMSTSISVNSERLILSEAKRPESPLLIPEYCYNANPTLHSNSLWKNPKTISQAVALRDAWKLTLQNHGCSGLVNEGAEGLLQAVVLSFAGLQFTSEHLALGTDAEVLHNEIGLSNIRYRNSTVDIFLKKQGDEDLPEIYVTRRELKKYAESLFACEAGCIMKLEQLGSSETKFPIFLTSPPTPILYISHLKEHLELLQHTLHVRESLSHQEHYEKHYNKSFAYFWWCFGIGFLIFHCILIRIICKEYSSWGSTPQQYSYRFRLQP